MSAFVGPAVTTALNIRKRDRNSVIGSTIDSPHCFQLIVTESPATDIHCLACRRRPHAKVLEVSFDVFVSYNVVFSEPPDKGILRLFGVRSFEHGPRNGASA